MKYETKVPCPVCETENIETSYTDEHGIVEEYYSCDKCTYFSIMAYSPTISGVCIKDYKKYKSNIDRNGIDVYLEDEYYALRSHLPI